MIINNHNKLNNKNELQTEYLKEFQEDLLEISSKEFALYFY